MPTATSRRPALLRGGLAAADGLVGLKARVRALELDPEPKVPALSGRGRPDRQRARAAAAGHRAPEEVPARGAAQHRAVGRGHAPGVRAPSVAAATRRLRGAPAPSSSRHRAGAAARASRTAGTGGGEPQRHQHASVAEDARPRGGHRPHRRRAQHGAHRPGHRLGRWRDGHHRAPGRPRRSRTRPALSGSPAEGGLRPAPRGHRPGLGSEATAGRGRRAGTCRGTPGPRR